ncbi:MAG: Maf family protein [Pirellulales bacterium]|nr:Maf family protein [Pirellulales bacterium]
MNRGAPKLILASRSPRRRELLTAASYDFEVLPARDEAEDELRPGEAPRAYVARLARQKAADVAAQIEAKRAGPNITAFDERVIVACDTIVVLGDELLGKPADAAHARRMLSDLSGREHLVLSGLCLWPPAGGAPRTEIAESRLRMDELSDAQIDEYVASGLWAGKAGGFGYQDRLGWLHVTAGSESNIVGLPLELLAEMLDG